MDTNQTPPATKKAPCWVVITRERTPVPLAVGPYWTVADADHALAHAALIDGFCEVDCLDTTIESWSPAPAHAEYELVIIDHADQHHTGRAAA